MKIRYFFATLLVSVSFTVPARAVGPQNEPHLLIAAVQTAEGSAAGNDFIVVHNPTSEPVDIAGWKLQYRSAGAKDKDSWTTKLTFACEATNTACTTIVAPNGNIVASTYTISGLPVHLFTSGFSDVGGQVRLSKVVAGQLQAVDFVGYGTAAESEAQAAPAPKAGKAIVRKSDSTGQLIDSDNNKNDFTESCVALTSAAIHQAIDCAKPADTSQQPTDEEDEAPEYSILDITELLPNPAPPLTDSDHEFIELYNPNNREVPLKGYTLQTGADFKYKYTFEEGVIGAGAYFSLFSADSGLSLANSGGQARLLDPSGKTIAIAASYESAKPDYAWVKSEANWAWSLRATPGSANIVEIEQPPIVPAVVKKPVATKTPAKKTTAASPAAKKAVKAASTTKAAKPKEPATSIAAIPPKKDPLNFNYLILAGVGLVVVAYACYEYRHELAKLWRKLRGASLFSHSAK
ncbi:MAG TPA: lamin tail domain-containing protein [Candidatus Saccharimonadales bacterium]|nr:lamin tail domain-containing protein [Candidatus Saccharimonadales bacterium]